MLPPINVLGGPLLSCSHKPPTGWFRDGCCNTDAEDLGSHTVCCQVTAPFLLFLKQIGNDLVTPRPQLGFSGLKPGDQWCVCASSWRRAYLEDKACPVVLESTHRRALEFVALEELMAHGVAMEA